MQCPGCNTHVTMPRLQCPGYNAQVTMPRLQYPGYNTQVTMLQCPGYNAQVTMPRSQCPGHNAQVTMPRLQCPGYNAQVTMPRLQCPGYNAWGAMPLCIPFTHSCLTSTRILRNRPWIHRAAKKHYDSSRDTTPILTLHDPAYGLPGTVRGLTRLQVRSTMHWSKVGCTCTDYMQLGAC